MNLNVLGSRDVDDVSDIKQAILHVCLDEYDNEFDADDTSDVDEILEQGNQSKPPQKGKFALLPPTASPPEDDDNEIGTALRQIFSENSVQSPYSCSISLPTPLKLVSALKGSREKQGLSPKKLSVTWAPDVYDPPPTSLLHMVRSKKQQKSKKNNDKKKNGKKGQKGNNSSRSSARGKDNKQFCRSGWSSYSCYKQMEVEDQMANTSDDLADFNDGSPDPYCGSSFLKKSSTRMHFSIADAL